MADTELWRLVGVRLLVVCTEGEIHDRSQPWGNTLLGWDLRLDHGGELKRSEFFRDRQALEARSQEWRNLLLENSYLLHPHARARGGVVQSDVRL